MSRVLFTIEYQCCFWCSLGRKGSLSPFLPTLHSCLFQPPPSLVVVAVPCTIVLSSASLRWGTIVPSQSAITHAENRIKYRTLVESNHLKSSVETSCHKPLVRFVLASQKLQWEPALTFCSFLLSARKTCFSKSFTKCQNRLSLLLKSMKT